MYPEFRTPGFKPRAFARGQWGITWPRDPLTRGSLTPGASPGTTVSHPRARAPPIDHALLALRAPCDADAAPMQDEGVREPGPLVARHQRHQVALDLLRCFLFRETEQRRQALHVRVHYDPFTLPEPGAQHHVRGLAPHPGELDQLLHGIRHLAPVALQERLRHPDDRFRLVAEEPGAVNILLEDLGIRRGVVLRRLVLCEQRRGDDVDPSVRGLSGEDRRDEQLERVRVVERAHGVGVGPLEAGDDLTAARPGFGGRLAPIQGPSLSLRWHHRHHTQGTSSINIATLMNQGCSVAGGTYSARTRSSTFGRRGPSSPRQKRVEHPYEVLRRLDVRGVPSGELDHPRVERRRELPRR